MAQNFSSLCCCSCCCLLSPSPQQSSQQPPISISSPPPHQSIASHSTPSSPSQQPTPTPNITDFKIFLEKFNDISQIDTLISFLEELVKIASGEKSDGGSTSAVASHIHDGQRILEMLDTRFGKRPATQNSADSTIVEIETVCIEVLKGSEKIPKVGIALCMLGCVLDRFSMMSGNKSECLVVLRRMVDLGKQIVKLNEQIPDQKEKLNEGVQCIIEGTIMCISQLSRANIFREIVDVNTFSGLTKPHLHLPHLHLYLMQEMHATCARLERQLVLPRLFQWRKQKSCFCDAFFV